MMQKVVYTWIALSLALAVCSVELHGQGQGVYGAITGGVTDPSGAGVPGASVVATNLATGVKVPTKSDSAGYYTVVGLIAGTYSVEVSAPGFKTASGLAGGFSATRLAPRGGANWKKSGWWWTGPPGILNPIIITWPISTALPPKRVA